jgi:methionyl-tRNA formyltransferase
MSKIKTVFMGSDEIALRMLDHLVCFFSKKIELIAVFTQPDRRSGRGLKLKENRIKTWAQEHGIAVYQPQKIDTEILKWMHNSGCSLVLVMAYGHLLNQKFLDIPELGVFNMHTSLLPAYRGASPIESAIAYGEKETGVTLMQISLAMDAGPIIDQEKISIKQTDTAPDLYKRLGESCVPLLSRNLPLILKNKANLTAQNHNNASYCRRLTKADGALDFSAPARTLYNRIRALQPWPGCFFKHKGVQIKVGESLWSSDSPSSNPGQVIGLNENAIVVATGEGMLLLKKLQRPGGRMLWAKDFVRGFPIETDCILQSAQMTSLVTRKNAKK